MNLDLEKLVPEGQNLLPNNLTINDMAVAYVESVLEGAPTENPMWQTRVMLRDGRWMDVRFNVEHEWIKSPLEGITQ